MPRVSVTSFPLHVSSFLLVDEQQAQQSQAAAAGGEETPEPQAAPSGNLRGDQPRKAAEKSATFSRTNEKDTYKRKGYDKRSPTLTLGKVVFPIYESKPKGKKSRFVSGSKKREGIFFFVNTLARCMSFLSF